MEITIRRIVLADAPALAGMARQTFYDTFTGTCTEDDMQQYLEQYYNLAQVEAELKDEHDLYFFAEADGVPVGYIRFMEDYTGWQEVKQWKSLELKRLYVVKEFHGKKIAQQLMDYYINYATQHQYRCLWLGVWEFNMRAQKFYEKYGFKDSGHRHPFPIGNTPQTDNWYWKFLP
jgi:ribosomal protein S18 acetylase RimI-like enzyme